VRRFISTAGAGLFLLAVVVLGFVALTLQRFDLPDTEPAAQSSQPAAAPAPGGSSTPAAPAAPTRLLILGDSFTAGVGASATDNGWAPQVAEALDGPDRIDAVPRTGYVFPGPDRAVDDSFPSRTQRLVSAGDFTPDVVVVQGGQEDYRGTLLELDDAVRETVTRLRAAYPQARIVLFGSTRAFPESRALEPINATIAKAAATVDVPFIDPVAERWITSKNSARYISYDLTHPNDAGHAYLAERFLEDFRALPTG